MLLAYKNALMGFIIVFSLAGCGGGGGDAGTPSNPEPFSFLGFKDLTPGLTTSFSLTGSDSNGDLWSASWILTNQNPIVLNEQSVTPIEGTVHLENITNGGFITGTSTEYYSAGFILNLIEYGSGETCTPSTFSGLPDSATIGQGGTVGILECSDGSTNTITWRLEASGNDAKLIISSSSRNFSGVLEYSEDDKYLMNTSGGILGLEIKIFEPPSFTLNLSGQ